jgi:hypothetical protein
MKKSVQVAIALGVGVAVVYWLRTRLIADASQNTQGVTRSSSGGNFSDATPTSTTPIKTAAYAAARSTLDTLRAIVGGTGTSSSVPSAQANLSANPRFTAYNNRRSAKAARAAPTANVVQNSRASTYIPQ